MKLIQLECPQSGEVRELVDYNTEDLQDAFKRGHTATRNTDNIFINPTPNRRAVTLVRFDNGQHALEPYRFDTAEEAQAFTAGVAYRYMDIL